jgi:uncharacterized protein involved in type VI secretion and phage assembly
VSQALFDSITRIARHEARGLSLAAAGKVTDVFTSSGTPPDHAVTIELRDSKVILPRVPIAVAALGFAAIPAVGDLVIVLFLDGDMNAPVVVGRLYHADEHPPEHDEDQLVLRLPAGSSEPKLQVVIDGAAPRVTVDLPGKLHLELAEEKGLLRVGDDGDAMQVLVSGEGGGSTEISAGKARITIKKDGDITISTTGNLKLEGDQIEISGSSKVKVTGAEVDIN